MAINLAGLGIIYNNYAGATQQLFQLNAVSGGLSVVVVNGRIQDPSTYTIDRSVLKLNTPLAGGEWVYVLSGQGGTFIPQSYVDDLVKGKADITSIVNLLQGKADKTGTSFTGEVNIQEPTRPMNPVTFQMWKTLPPIATPAYVDGKVDGKATVGQLNTAIANLLPSSTRGSSNGVAGLDENRNVFLYNLPDTALRRDKSFFHRGVLTVSTIPQRWFPRDAGILQGMIAYAATAPTGAEIVIDIRRNGISIFDVGSRVRIADGANYGERNLVTPPTFVRGDVFTIHIEQIGSTTAGSDVTFQFEYVVRS